MINFKKDFVYDLFLQFINGENQLFTYEGCGISKLCFSFLEESTMSYYVIKVEKTDYPELYYEYADMEYSNSPSDCDAGQVAEEILCYKRLLESHNKGIDLLAPIILEQSDPDRNFEVMVYCDSYNEGDDISVEMRKSNNELVDSLTEKSCEFYDYLSRSEVLTEDYILEIETQLDALEEADRYIFYDLHDGNVGYYNGKLVIIDYGYAY